MNAETIPLVEAHPSSFDVAVLRLPPGSVARVHHPSGVREYRPLLVDEGAYAVVPGSAQVIGWGAVPCWHSSVRGIRNGKHRLDRSAWHHAASLLRATPVVYVAYEQIDYFGRLRWTAVSAGIRPLVGQGGAA